MPVINTKRLEFVRVPPGPNGRSPDVLRTNSVVLDDDGPKFTISMLWRPVAASWFLTLRLTSGTPIVSGAPVRDRTDCLLGISTPGRPLGAIISYDPKGRGDPTLDSYARDGVSLYYLPDGFNPQDFTVYRSEVV